ncbi:MAG: carboxypeptidase regulatory-like domain-containing protein [Acidobacteria bacterium]|nr:carboxypeptidase regulatory-like domain-containing protein [Acidobacteriota bacterium]MBI3424629.1 carboxypeptidase regulatory-like domain-containing protein [Acidobacteriota bacterium]
MCLSRSSFLNATICRSLLTLLTLCTTASAQRSTGTISGRVVGEDGQPIPRAVISILALSGKLEKMMSGRMALKTDAEGKFEATGLDPSPYTVIARAPGYLPAQPLDPANPEYHYLGESVTLVMRKGGVITGKVTTANGEPVVGVEVSTVSLDPAASVTAAFSMDLGSGQIIMRQTDDRGVYRLYGVQPGKYLIVAGATGFSLGTTTPFRGNVPTYYPGATRDTATPITVQSGEELSGMDIRYRGESGFAISGKVTGLTTGNTMVAVQSSTVVLLKRPGATEAVAMTVMIPSAGQNSYGFYGVPNGEYELIASQVSLSDDNQSAAAPRRITINGADLSGVDLALTPLAVIKGKVILEKPAEAAAQAAAAKCANPRESQLDEVVILARKDDPNPKPEIDLAALGVSAPAVAEQQGAFSLRGLTTGRYRIAARFPDASWYLRALSLTPANPALPEPARNGLPVKAGDRVSGLVVAVAPGAASLKGVVKPATGAKLPASLRVFLVPAEPEAKDDVLRYAEAEAGTNGEFSIASLAPGKYWLLARVVPATETAEKRLRPVAWDSVERLRLRKEAETSNVLVELKTCQAVMDFVLQWK